MNNNLILIVGKATTGKSASLRNLKEPSGVAYLNCENNKALPFRSKFQSLKVTDPYQVYQAFDELAADDSIHTIVIDTATYLMDMMESIYVLPSTNTQKAWGDYAQYFIRLMQQYVANSDKRIIILAHTADVANESEMTMETIVKVKGSLMSKGIESFFTQVVATKRLPLKKLKEYDNPLLQVTEEDELLGYKHVFQTLPTKETAHERIRSPMGMWDRKETFIDNDVELVLDRIAEYYEA